MLSYVGGEYAALAYRRGVTHGLPALLILPFVVAAVMMAYDRWGRRARARGLAPARAGPTLVLAAVGLATHPSLDWMNTYGMRWLLPFDGTWSYGDSLFIIDPWIWLLLGGALAIAAPAGPSALLGWLLLGVACSTAVLLAPVGLVPKAVWCAGVFAVVTVRHWRARMGPPPSRTRVVRVAIIAATFYLAVMVGAGAVARREVAVAAAKLGLETRGLMVAPNPANPFTAEVEVLTGLGYVPGSHRWMASPRVILRPDRVVPLLAGPGELEPAHLAALVASARRDPAVRDYLVWSRYPYVRVATEGDGWRVHFSDARYDGRAGAGGLAGVSAFVTEPGPR